MDAVAELTITLHVGSPAGYASEPIRTDITHDAGCCASVGCHMVCSHLCGTELHTCDGTPHTEQEAAP